MEKYLKLANRLFLGLLMFIPGIMKFFAIILNGMDGLTALFLALVLVILEIICGSAILANYKLKYAVIPPVVILIISALTTYIGDVSSLLLHLVAISGYLMLGYRK